MSEGESKKSSQQKTLNLVYLVFSGNVCYTEVRDRNPDPTHLTVDTEKGTWSYNHPVKGHRTGTSHTGPIGAARHSAKYDGYNIIGVYDRDNIRHLTTMIRDAQHATSDDRDFDD